MASCWTRLDFQDLDAYTIPLHINPLVAVFEHPGRGRSTNRFFHPDRIDDKGCLIVKHHEISWAEENHHWGEL